VNLTGLPFLQERGYQANTQERAVLPRSGEGPMRMDSVSMKGGMISGPLTGGFMPALKNCMSDSLKNTGT